jgi:hypothetical protein
MQKGARHEPSAELGMRRSIAVSESAHFSIPVVQPAKWASDSFRLLCRDTCRSGALSSLSKNTLYRRLVLPPYYRTLPIRNIAPVAPVERGAAEQLGAA